MVHQDFALYLLAPVPWIFLILHNSCILHKMGQSFQLRTELPSNLHSPIKILLKKKSVALMTTQNHGENALK